MREEGKFRIILALFSLGLFIYLLPFVLPQGNDYVPLRKLVIFAVVTLVLVVGTGAGTPPGLALVATPQPLPLGILPGTLTWNQDGVAVSFLVTQGSGFGSQNATGLCFLDLRLASERAEGPGAGQATPLHYLGEVSAGRLWEQPSSGFSNLTGVRSYPLNY
ncbi:MAG: hypothetical protein HGB17_19215, partial [Syntrophobacteraceae bacterium]|nr:hypothetical protein [Syntrophobacteraceae bacterium]